MLITLNALSYQLLNTDIGTFNLNVM